MDKKGSPWLIAGILLATFPTGQAAGGVGDFCSQETQTDDCGYLQCAGAFKNVSGPTCQDEPGWVDVAGDNCTVWAQNGWCAKFGDKVADSAGVFANAACCACGGGEGYGEVFTCSRCTSSEQCQRGPIKDYMACKLEPIITEEGFVCTIKSLFNPFLWLDGVTGALAFCAGVFASGAGIGGGGLYVPLFVLTGWGKEAVSRSLAATTGLSIAMMTMLANQRHPEVNRPQIDYKAMLLLEPIVLLGTIPGKLLNKVFPTLIIYVLLLVTLVATTVLTWRTFCRLRAKEAEEAENEALEAAADKDAEAGKKLNLQSRPSSHFVTTGHEIDDDTPGLAKSGGQSALVPAKIDAYKEGMVKLTVPDGVQYPAILTFDYEGHTAVRAMVPEGVPPGSRFVCELADVADGADAPATGMENIAANHMNENNAPIEDAPSNKVMLARSLASDQLKEIYATEAKQPVLTIVLLLLCWAFLLVISILTKTISECGSTVFWVLQVLYIPALASFSVIQMVLLFREEKKHQQLGYHYASGDVHWTAKNLAIWPIVFSVAGVGCSLLGIGGGMILGPLLLGMGFNPVVSSATTACMTLFTASSAAIQFLIIDTSTWDYFLYYVFIAFAAGLLGRIVIRQLIARTGKQSIVVAMLAGLISASGIAMTYVTVQRIVEVVESGQEFGFDVLCPVEGLEVVANASAV